MKQYDSYKDSGQQWLGQIPNHWNRIRIKYCLSRSIAGVWGKDAKGDNNDIVCFRIADFDYNKGVLSFEKITIRNIHESQLCGRLLKKGDLLIEKSGGGESTPIGRVVRYNYHERATCSNFIHVISVKDNYSNGFLYYYFCGLYANKQNLLYFNQTTGIQNLKIGEYLSQTIFIPSFLEQIAIASYLDEQCEEIDKAIAQQQRMIDLLNERKQIIIQQAVTKGLNPNAKMKDSGQQWLGKIPSHWGCRPIKQFKSKCKNAFVDGPFGSNLKSEHFIDNGEVFVVESGTITSGVFKHSKLTKTISLKHFQTICRSECKEDDVIIAKIGANYGMAGILPNLSKRAVVSGNSLKITLDHTKIENQYFVYLMQVAKMMGGFKDMVSETAQPALSLGGLNNMYFPLPNLDEQKNILEYIDTNICPMQAIIQNCEKLIECLKERKQIIINEAVTGKIKVT